MSLWTDEELRQYQRDGYLVTNSLLTLEEVDGLRKIAQADKILQDQAASRRDGQGGTIRLTVQNDLGRNIYSAIARSRRIVDRMELLLDGEVYHYHHKMIWKDAHSGGAWEWHQDYGYWYETGCLFPDLASCLIAVDPATKANGCLQVLAGSHRIGRINHGPVGDQTGADPERVAEAVKRLPLVYVELPPGSAVFFHCNLLHRSDANLTDQSRWAFICCYNAARNNPYKESRHPRYQFLEKAEDSLVLDYIKHHH